ncbi:MAG: tetratricopeptide repeat protein, partial [Rhodoferax sp.]|nr:tetratricopeptide repeat protein [Rhodoferax sp.]
MPQTQKLIQAIELQNKGDIDTATQLFREILAASPDNPHALYSLGLIELNAGHLDQALALCSHGVKANPQF